LPAEDREVFDLIYYQGLSQAEAAGLLDISERTLQRRWQSARLALHDALAGQLPV
jgi:RNA polymerase sigma-70 factor (ECF subfamily)